MKYTISQFVLRLLIFVHLVSCSNINLVENKYINIVIGINPEIEENLDLLNNIQSIWTEASEVLWQATKQRTYFGEITVIVPKTWSGTYPASRNLTYSGADVIIANENVQYGDMPYTLQFGQCGEPGKYMHLTPNYLLNSDVVENYGPKGKAIVHEWAHLRWGVYDESATEGYDGFYYDKNGKLEATRCPVALKGENIAINWTTGEMKPCQSNQYTNWVPTSNCTFIPYKEQDPALSTSLMSHQYMDQAYTFCHDDPSDPINLHNREAPNEHNRLCNQRSMWDVIMSSNDFANEANLPNPSIVSTVPNFKFVQPKENRFVLVLDISGTMNGKKFQDMQTVLHDILSQYISDGSEVAMVQFYTQADVLHDLVKINSMSDREQLLAVIPDGIHGLGSIGIGISTAVSILQNSGSTVGSHIVVLTDGTESYAPYISDVHDEVTSNGIILSTLTFGDYLNSDLELLAKETDGDFIINVNDFSLVKEMFQSYSESVDGDQSQNILLVSEALHKMSINDLRVESVVLDGSVGKDTIFEFQWSESWVGGEPVIKVTDPNGKEYCSHPTDGCFNEGVGVNNQKRTVVFQIPDVAQGKWEYSITTSNHYQYVNVKVTTKALQSNVPPIVVESSLSKRSFEAGDSVIIYSKVSQGYNAVLGAKVEALISCPDGTVVTLDLTDSGSAPDARKSDGVYSRYFSSFVGNGQYSVTVSVTGSANNPAVVASSVRSTAAYNSGYIDSNDVVVLNPNGGKVQVIPAPSLIEFSRISDAGGFTYTGPIITTYNDVYAPARVLDLSAVQKDPLDGLQGIIISFTAPGDDNDVGTASQYELRYRFDNFDLLTTSFENCHPIYQSMLTSGNLMKPGVAGNAQTFTVFLPNIPADEETLVIGFAVRTTDDVGNTAESSNVAVINLFIKPPEIGCIDDNGVPYSGEPFKKIDDCDDFYQCSNGELNMIHCQPGTVFNPIIKVCDHPANVPECQ